VDAGRFPKSSKYELIARIGTGGMGSVYVGHLRGAAGFQRRVAVKRANSSVLDTEEGRESLLREARHASLVRHPNVVSIDDVEEVGGELLLVMDYVEGASLAELATAGHMPLGAAIRIALDIASGLAAVHEAKDENDVMLGLVHRDVSPHNILVGLDGVARIADFGIAKAVADPGSTMRSMRKGKLAYMAPEYLTTGVFRACSDIFAFGVVLWEMLSAERLFRGETESASIQNVMRKEIPPLLGVPRSIAAITFKALERDPQKRFSTMAELAEALELAAPLDATRTSVARMVASIAREGLVARRAALSSSSGVTGEIPTLSSGNVQLEGATAPAGPSAIASAAAAKGATATIVMPVRSVGSQRRSHPVFTLESIPPEVLAKPSRPPALARLDMPAYGSAAPPSSVARSRVLIAIAVAGLAVSVWLAMLGISEADAQSPAAPAAGAAAEGSRVK